MNASERIGRLCVISSVERGHIGTLAHSSFRWNEARIFNALPSTIRNCSNCDVLVSKRGLDNYLPLLPDIPCTPNKDNSITGTVVEDQSWCFRGVPRIWQGGGQEFFFSDLGICMSQSALLGGFGGMPPENFFF